jgi:sugar phosphate isomerase/epimerase
LEFWLPEIYFEAMLTSRTGGFAIGFRRGWSDWQKDLGGVISFAKQNELGVIDVGGDADLIGAEIGSAGLRIGSADLRHSTAIISSDPAKRKEALEVNEDYIAKAVAAGATNFFTVLIPQDPSRPRSETFGHMIEGLNLLGPILEKNGAKLVIEGWPGPGALACTPEGYRATLEQTNSKSIGINYDPSHLIRMGIDPIRFLSEFGERVYHVHGKDTELFPEAVYEFGTEQPPTLAKSHGFGSVTWRYTIPGFGVTPWLRVFEILKAKGYQGAVSIELEDENFNGSEEGEKQGILSGAKFLASI